MDEARCASIVAGDGTPTITLKFTHTGSGVSVEETVYAVQGGTKGTTGDTGQALRFASMYSLNGDGLVAEPTEGSFATPISTANAADGWEATPQDLVNDGDKVYESNRLFTDDGLSPQEASWSTPGVQAWRVDGVIGPDGLRTVQGYLFYEKTTVGDPPPPGSTTYTFATGDVDGGTGTSEVRSLLDGTIVDKWTNEPRVQDPTTPMASQQKNHPDRTRRDRATLS